MTIVTEKPKLVTVFGGSGFVGRHVVRALARRGYRVLVACRRPDLAGHLQPLGNVGQIRAVQANVRVRWSVDRVVEGADHVINLVAIMAESGRQRFTSVHEVGARAIAEAAREAGAKLTHISALGADLESPSVYARTKARGERAVFDTLPDSVVFRPCFVFGPEDRFYNRFANMARFSPILPLVGADTKIQPVFVGDLAEAIARSVDGDVAGGKIYEVGGPEVMTFRESQQEMLDIIDRKRWIVSIPWPVARVQGSLLGMLPKPLLTRDQVTLLGIDNVVSAEAERDGRTLPGLGIRPQATGAILPTYLWRFRPAGQFTRKTFA